MLKKLNLLIIAPLFIYVFLRIVLININYTEWGDTFRMIRAAEYLSEGIWPWDEKRWPFYSVLLIPGIWLNDRVFFGRILSFVSTILTFIYVYKMYLKTVDDFDGRSVSKLYPFSFKQAINWFKNNILGQIPRNNLYALLAVVLLAVTPVYAYWSIRVMADPIFTFLVIFYSYLFISYYQKVPVLKKEIFLSIILLCITMTRLEGVFMLMGTVAFFALAKNAKKLIIYLIPQILIYFPFTLYAKVLYKGPVNNDYLKEVQTFVFNLDRFNYFATYTAFILVFPILTYLLYLGIISIKSNLYKLNKNVYLPYLPLLIFIILELLIGFIWTPSLPRIYMPIIPFFVILAVYGLQKVSFKERSYQRLAFFIISLILFAFLQYNYKLYFLGASKILFILILLFGILSCSLLLFSKETLNIKKYLAVIIVSIGFISSSVIIYNQKDVYKSVYQASLLVSTIAFESPQKERIAFSDETGTTSWYLKNNYVYYLEQSNKMDDLNEQYKTLHENEVSYLIITNEFNRGSQFIDPKGDPRYSLVAVFSVPIYDLADYVLHSIGVISNLDSDIFVTKVYKVL